MYDRLEEGRSLRLHGSSGPMSSSTVSGSPSPSPRTSATRSRSDASAASGHSPVPGRSAGGPGSRRASSAAAGSTRFAEVQARACPAAPSPSAWGRVWRPPAGESHQVSRDRAGCRARRRQPRASQPQSWSTPRSRAREQFQQITTPNSAARVSIRRRAHGPMSRGSGRSGASDAAGHATPARRQAAQRRRPARHRTTEGSVAEPQVAPVRCSQHPPASGPAPTTSRT